jgi:hypothetical protein
MPADSRSVDLGPQPGRGAPFITRMRWHQSWYRAEVLGLPCGTGPRRTDTRLLGNMLTEEAGRAGRNFLCASAFARALSRIVEGPGVEPFRCLRNMLSSQPMCFNLLGPLAVDLALATRCFRALLPAEVAEVLELRFEYAPAPAADYLGDRTSFDAFVSYRRTTGGRGFIAVETKLTEPFARANPRPIFYLDHVVASPHLWRADSLSQLGNPRWYQLWRNHMLAERLRARPEAGFEHALIMVIHHPGDPDCAAAIAGYRALLPEGYEGIIAAPLDSLLRAWEPQLGTLDHEHWAADFRLRYLDLDRSR